MHELANGQDANMNKIKSHKKVCWIGFEKYDRYEISNIRMPGAGVTVIANTTTTIITGSYPTSLGFLILINWTSTVAVASGLAIAES